VCLKVVTVIIKPTVKDFYRQLNRSLMERLAESRVVKNKLESGLGAERGIRSILVDFLPTRFGVARGWIINNAGDLSRHCDIIIYDRLNCPNIYVDNNDNQVIPIEGVYQVIEVKTTLTKKILTEAFSELRSIYDLEPDRPIRSLNTHVDFRPPGLSILGFRGPRLVTIKRHYEEMNREHDASNSFSAYSIQSPGYVADSKKFLIKEVACLGVGAVFHALSGYVAAEAYGEYTLGMFLTMILSNIEQIPSQEVNILRYFNADMIENPDDWFVIGGEWL